MRAVLIMSLVLAIGGCASTRQALGLYKRTADRGVTLGGRPDEGVAPPGSASGETTPARTSRSERRAAKVNLPTGLGGDKEHRAYTTPQ